MSKRSCVQAISSPTIPGSELTQVSTCPVSTRATKSTLKSTTYAKFEEFRNCSKCLVDQRKSYDILANVNHFKEIILNRKDITPNTAEQAGQLESETLRNIATQHRNIATPQHSNIAISQH